jgi:hypothetical protein
MLESQFSFLRELDFHAEMSQRMDDFGGTYVKEHLADALLGVAAWLPALLLAPFLAFFFLRDGRRFLKYIAEAVPNAYFERTLYMIDRVHGTARAYFQGLLKLTLIDTICLAIGLAAIGMPGALALGLMSAVLAWVPFIGSVIGCVIVVLVAATDFPASPWVVYAAIGLFLFVRLLDDFVFMPLTVGRSLHMHPLPTVLFIFLGGAVAGVPGLILVLPLAGVVMVVAGTIGGIVNDPRLGARNAFAKKLHTQRITADLQPSGTLARHSPEGIRNMTAPPLRIGIAGVGRMGRHHASNLAHRVLGASLVAACSPVEDELKWAREHLGTADVYTDYAKMLAHPGLDAVWLVTPTTLHADQIVQALEAGKHVFSEKPLALNLPDCLRVEAVAAKHPKQVAMIGYVRRFDPSYRDAFDKIKAGTIGRPFLARSQTTDKHDPSGFFVAMRARPGGILLDMSVHDIDTVRWLLGAGGAKRVFADRDHRRPRGTA